MYREVFRVQGTPEATLQVWQRQLNIMFEQPVSDVLTYAATTGLGASTYTLRYPFSGDSVLLYCSNANSSDYVQVYTGSTAIFFGPASNLRVRFTQAGQLARLTGISNSRWAIESLGSTTVTTSLPTFST